MNNTEHNLTKPAFAYFRLVDNKGNLVSRGGYTFHSRPTTIEGKTSTVISMARCDTVDNFCRKTGREKAIQHSTELTNPHHFLILPTGISFSQFLKIAKKMAAKDIKSYRRNVSAVYKPRSKRTKKWISENSTSSGKSFKPGKDAKIEQIESPCS